MDVEDIVSFVIFSFCNLKDRVMVKVDERLAMLAGCSIASVQCGQEQSDQKGRYASH